MFLIYLLSSPTTLFVQHISRVKNMRIDEETTFSMRVAWQPVDSRNVRHYQLSYISAKGDRAEETVRQKTVCLVLPAQLGHFNSRWQFLFVL